MFNGTFFEAAAILLREGLEAILVLAAIGAYMTKMGAGDRLSALYGGAGAAIIASIAMAWGLSVFNNGVHNDLVEGFVMLLAAALMFYVSGWLFLKQDPRQWQAYLKEHTDKVVDGGTLVATAVLAFLAVFREGAETVLFLHALAKSSGGWSSGLLAGLVAASVGLCAIFVMVTKATKRLPLRPVFLITSAFMFVMGLRFVGAGLQEFQEQALIGFHPAPWSDWLIALGLNASWEAVAAQIMVLILAGGSVVAMLRTRDGAPGRAT